MKPRTLEDGRWSWWPPRRHRTLAKPLPPPPAPPIKAKPRKTKRRKG